MPVEGYSNADWLAGASNEGSYNPTQLFTAEDDIKTNAATYATGQNLAVLTILAFNSDDELVQWNPGGASPVTIPVGIAAADMNTTSPAGARKGPFWQGGCFNPELLVWPAALESASNDERMAALALAPAPFRIKQLL